MGSMKVQSAKAKGRNLCKLVKEKLLVTFPFLEEDDIKVTSSGAGGEDLQLSPAARKILPISIECKAQEKMNIWASWEQATTNAKNFNPVLIFKRNNKKPLVCITLEYFLELEANQKGK
jgi:hypothetical protein